MSTGDATPDPAGDNPFATPPAPAAEPWGQPSTGAQPPAGQPQYGQPAYGQPQYGQPQYGQPQYGQPAGGQPAYGQPWAQPGPAGPYAGQWGTPPPKKRRTWLIVTLSVVGVILAVVVAGVIYEAVRPHKHLHLEPAAGLVPATNPQITNALNSSGSLIEARKQGFGIAAFQRSSPDEIVLLGGGDIKRFKDPDDYLRGIATGFTNGATGSGATVSPFTSEPAGPRGGKVNCSSLTATGSQVISAVCVYSDDDTAGLLFSVGQDQVATAALLSRYRVAEER